MDYAGSLWTGSLFDQRLVSDFDIILAIKEEAKIKIPVEDFLSNTASYLIYFIAIIFALNQLGLAVKVLYFILLLVCRWEIGLGAWSPIQR